MIRTLSCVAILSLLGLVSLPARADSGIFLTFQGLGNLQQVGNFYDGSGLSGTPNYGVSFSANFYAEKSFAQGGAGNFNLARVGPAIFLCPGGPPNCGGTQMEGMMNVTGGFSGINFFYVTGQTETVTVWSGANGTGTVLATIQLTSNSCGGFPTYCQWGDYGQLFTGTAHSITFSGSSGNMFGLSDITLGSRSAAIPEPSTFYLLGGGVVGIFAGKLRRFFGV